MKISQEILRFVGGSTIRSTTDIENFGIGLRCSQRQVLGGIGYLRREGLLNIVNAIKNPVTQRKEHLFQ